MRSCGVGPARPVRTARSPAGRAGGRRAARSARPRVPTARCGNRAAAGTPWLRSQARRPPRPAPIRPAGCATRRALRRPRTPSAWPSRRRPRPGGRTRAASPAPCQAAAQAEWRSSGVRRRWPWPAAPRRSPPRHRAAAAPRTPAAARAWFRTPGRRPSWPDQPRAVEHPHLALAREPPADQRPLAAWAAQPACGQIGLHHLGIHRHRQHASTQPHTRPTASHGNPAAGKGRLGLERIPDRATPGETTRPW
jgi:hypothetical protein